MFLTMVGPSIEVKVKKNVIMSIKKRSLHKGGL